MPIATYVALDGSRVTVSTRRLDLGGRPFSSHVVALLGPSRVRHDFTAGAPMLGESAAAYYGISLGEQFSLQGGTLGIGVAGDNGGQRFAIWQGKRSSIITTIYNNHGPADAIALFDRFDIHEASEGSAVLIPRDISETSFEDTPSVIKDVRNVGLFEVMALTPTTRRFIPSWAGTRVAGGELFVSDRGMPAMRFVLVGERTVTQIMPAGRAAEDERVVDELAALRVTWEPS